MKTLDKNFYKNLPKVKSKWKKRPPKCSVDKCKHQVGSIIGGHCTIHPVRDKYTQSVCYSFEPKKEKQI